MRKKIAVGISLVVLIMLHIAIGNITIFKTEAQESERIFNIFASEYNPENGDICILKYGQVTGAGWYVKKSTDKELEGKYVCMSAVCNPRNLKENKDFYLDMTAEYVVRIRKSDNTVAVDNERVKIIYPDEIVITNYEQGIYKRKFKDLSLKGKVQTLKALFIPKLRLSY